jgi:type II secretory pathway component PulL
MPADPNSKLTLNIIGLETQIASEIKKVLDDRFNEEVNEAKSDVKSHSPHFLTRFMGVEGFILLILLCLSSFMGYQQWQQSQQINQLIKQLAPTSQTSPPPTSP